MNAVNHNDSAIVIWRFSDGRAGHDSQSLGLIQALEKLAVCVSHKIDIASSPAASPVHFLLKRFPPGHGLPDDPDLIIGAGHGTHMPMLCARHARGGKIVVLMRPSLPVNWFDCCLIPAHDCPVQKDNLIITRGALNTITPANVHNPDSGMILVGGKSRHYGWDNAGLETQIRQIIETGITWQITDSPRTPASTRELLQNLSAGNIEYTPYHNSDRGWLAQQLRHAGPVWVTEDSISMIYEALTAGAAVGLLHMPVIRPGRITQAIAGLDRTKLITRFADWRAGAVLSPADPPINEASRCARLILEKLSR